MDEKDYSFSDTQQHNNRQDDAAAMAMARAAYLKAVDSVHSQQEEQGGGKDDDELSSTCTSSPSPSRSVVSPPQMIGTEQFREWFHFDNLSSTPQFLKQQGAVFVDIVGDATATDFWVDCQASWWTAHQRHQDPKQEQPIETGSKNQKNHHHHHDRPPKDKTVVMSHTHSQEVPKPFQPTRNKHQEL